MPTSVALRRLGTTRWSLLRGLVVIVLFYVVVILTILFVRLSGRGQTSGSFSRTSSGSSGRAGGMVTPKAARPPPPLEGVNWDRLEYYIGDVPNSSLDRRALRELLRRTPGFDKPFIFTLGESRWNAKGTPHYWDDLAAHCRLANCTEGTSFVVEFGDSSVPEHLDAVVAIKSRTLSKEEARGGRGSRSRGLLLPMNTARHWADISMDNFSFVPWEDKRGELVWRGTTTGKEGGRRGWVEALASNGHDVKFDHVTQGRREWLGEEEQYKGQPMTRREMMGFKYVLSLEGNDVATSCKWILSHNSVMVMPTPTKESWLMEGLLQPYVHYVPLNDPADAGALLDWMRSHDEECQQIVRNANEWMKQFGPGQDDVYIEALLAYAAWWLERQFEANYARPRRGRANAVMEHLLSNLPLLAASE